METGNNQSVRRKKRLCIMIPGHWSKIMGGAQYQVKCLIEELIKKDRYDIYCLSRDADPAYQSEGYQLVRYGYPGINKRGVHRHLFEMLLLPSVLKKIDPDVIYQRVGCSQTGIAARYSQKNNCGMIWQVASEYDLTPHRITYSRLIIEKSIDKWLLDYGIRQAKQIVVQTEDQGRMLYERFQRQPHRIIRNFHPLPENSIDKSGRIKVVWVSNLKDVKQPELFIRLSKELRALENIKFIMVGALQGGARNKRRYQALISEVPGLSYVGGKTQAEVNAILANAHIFVNTSRREGFPNTFIQAWMRKVPVVSLSVDPDQLIRKHCLGLISGSFEKLKKDIVTLSSDAERRNKYGLNAYNYAIENHSLKNIEKLISLMDSF